MRPTKNIDIELNPDAIIVFDTSALLNFYEYSNDSRDEIFDKIKENFDKKLWIPYNVKSEFIKNREKPINEQIKHYEDLNNNIKSISNLFEQIKNRTKSTDKHPIVNPELISKFDASLKVFFDSFEKDSTEKKSQLEQAKHEDDILTFVNSNFSVGEPFTYSKTIEIIKEGEFRYKQSIPPGYKDFDSKIGFQRYGDLIIWRQIVERTATEKKPIILVIDDLKEDWWIIDKKGKPLFPREELIMEIREKSNISFEMLTSAQFITKLTPNLSDKTSREVNEIFERISENIDSGTYLTSYDGTTHRNERLDNVLKAIQKLVDSRKIESLHDHKGSLEVTWRNQPSEIEKESVASAWELVGNECKENVIHIGKI